MKYWRLATVIEKHYSPDGDSTKADINLYAQCDTEDEAFGKFEEVCGHLPRKEFKVVEIDAVPEDETIL